MPLDLDETAAATPDDLAPARPALDLPSKVSRFAIESQLGAGGNGVVLLARDPLLDRHVAIKLVHRADDEAARQRLLREAQAVAKLVHENVIVVHEVGTFENQVYVAMEYVPGGTLTQWQKGRGWRACLDTYVRAGRGLAAAHAAGLVHRDFKPDNVLVGDDGRVRVTDFGLVAVTGAKPGHGPLPRASEPASGSLTRTGTIMGTPRYMAPEQHAGEPVDARADQFAFCAALYEAVYDRVPFDAPTYGELVERVLAGDVTEPPRSEVPDAIRDAILRGLSLKREARFASMTELLGVLRRAVEPRRRGWLPFALVGVGALALAIAVALFVVSRRDQRAAVAPRDQPVIADAAAPITAMQVYKLGQRAYDSANFEKAIEHFKHAFDLAEDDTARGVYLFNLALAHSKAGHCKEATFLLKRYLDLAPNLTPKRRVEAETLIAKCEAK